MILRTNGSLQNLQKTFLFTHPMMVWCTCTDILSFWFFSYCDKQFRYFLYVSNIVRFLFYGCLIFFIVNEVLLWIKILSHPFSILFSFVTTCSCWDFYCQLTLSNFFISWTTLFNEFTLSGITTSRSQEFELLISRTTEVSNIL